MNVPQNIKSLDSMRIVVCDLNGTLRGKRIPKSQLENALNGDMRLPLSIVGVDIWGEDIIIDGNVFDDGDKDGVAEFTGRGPLPIYWEKTPSALVPLWLKEEGENDFGGDPRRALSQITNKFADLGLTPVLATELEFYLYDDSQAYPQPPISPNTHKRLSSDNILSIAEIEAFESFFNDVYQACKDFDIPADTAISENGCGQFEINLLHVDSPLKAADDAVYFKYLVKSIARKHSLGASFMAKPYGERSGNGFHVHFSLLDKAGNNVFDNGQEEGSDTMLFAVNGLLENMADAMLIFAPHLNSYRRLQAGTHAPTHASWGYENRSSAIRIPGGSNKARRIEHRVAGADANPYLVIAAILGGALHGIENKVKPPQATEGDAYDNELPNLPTTWDKAIETFENSPLMKTQLNETLCDMFIRCKKQELSVLTNQISPFEYETYLEVV